MSETYSIGVDLGGTNLRIASYEGGVDFMDSVLLPTRVMEGPDRVVRDMCEAIEALRIKDVDSSALVLARRVQCNFLKVS